MSGSTDRNRATRLLDGLENGGMSAADARVVAEELDPVLVHSIVRYLREAYPASDPAASAVLQRVVELTSTYPEIVDKAREGEADPVSEWFAGEHRFREFRGKGSEMIEILVDKLET